MNTQGYQNPSESSQRISINNLIKNKSNFLIMGLLLLNTIPNITYSQVFNVSGNISAGNVPVRYAFVILTDVNDVSKKYSTITDSSGKFQLSVITEVSNEKPLVQQNIRLLQTIRIQSTRRLR